MSYELVGKLHKIYETENKSDKFKAREFVVETSETQYTQYIKFQLTQDRCDLLDKFQEGTQIKVHFDLRGREWQGKYFTNLNAWRLESPSPVASTPPPPAAGGGFPTTEPPAMPESTDELPF